MSPTPTADLTKTREWRRQTPTGEEILISTSLNLLDREWITTAFGTEDMYWAKPLLPDQLELMLEHSLTLGMYRTSPSTPSPKSAVEPSSPRTPSPTLEDEGADEKLEQIGMARIVTDYVTFVYLTDVYVVPGYRKDGLGKWIVACCKEVIDGTPELRRALLLTSTGLGRRFYERELGWWDVGEERESLACMTLKGWGFGS